MATRIPLHPGQRARLLQMLRETSLEEVLRGAALALGEYIVTLPIDDAAPWIKRRRLLNDAASVAHIEGA